MMDVSDKELMEKINLKKNSKKELKQRQYRRLILMAAVLESQITLKILAKSISFSSSKMIIKVLNKGEWIDVGKVI